MGFDEWFKKESGGSKGMQEIESWCDNAYEAGAASRQAEIDNLKAELETLQGMHNAVSLEAGNLVEEREELQNRVDEALNFYNTAKSDVNIGMMQMAIYLKGSKNEY